MAPTKYCVKFSVIGSNLWLPPVNGTDLNGPPDDALVTQKSVKTMATISVESFQDVIEQYIPLKRKGMRIKQVRQISDRELRKHLASEAAIQNYERSKDLGHIASARSIFIR